MHHLSDHLDTYKLKIGVLNIPVKIKTFNIKLKFNTSNPELSNFTMFNITINLKNVFPRITAIRTILVFPFKKITAYFSLKNYMHRLDPNEINILNKFFPQNFNSISLCPDKEEGIDSLIEKGILIPVDKEGFNKKRDSSFYFYLNKKARKIFQEKYLPK